MEALDNYKNSENEILKYFGIEEKLQNLVIVDNRTFYWIHRKIAQVQYGDTPEIVADVHNDDCFVEDIELTSNYEGPIWQGEAYTAIIIEQYCADPVIAIFDNSKKIS